MTTFVRRVALIVLLVAAPLLLTRLVYVGSKWLLAATSRTIDPQILWYAAIVEFLTFFAIAALEVKDRW